MPAICFVVMADIVILGPVSGGHVNPAITAGVCMGFIGHHKCCQKFCFCVMIIISQIIGGLLGCGAVWIISKTDDEAARIYPNIALLCPKTYTP